MFVSIRPGRAESESCVLADAFRTDHIKQPFWTFIWACRSADSQLNSLTFVGGASLQPWLKGQLLGMISSQPGLRGAPALMMYRHTDWNTCHVTSVVYVSHQGMTRGSLVICQWMVACRVSIQTTNVAAAQ